MSLLHATYHNPRALLSVRDAWLGRARVPGRVEYIVAMDDTDHESLAATAEMNRVVSPTLTGEVTAVRNWNAAALSATGDLLLVIADDLYPPENWDDALESVIGGLDPSCVPFVVKVNDSGRADDVLIRHPVVSRAFYEEFGLWSTRYRGICCDDDLTRRAFWKAAVLDGRSLELEHHNPFVRTVAGWTTSQVRMNAESEFEFGRSVLAADWGWWRRRAPVLPVRVGPGTSRRGLATTIRGRRLLSSLMLLRQIAIASTRRALHPSRGQPRRVERTGRGSDPGTGLGDGRDADDREGDRSRRRGNAQAG